MSIWSLPVGLQGKYSSEAPTSCILFRESIFNCCRILRLRLRRRLNRHLLLLNFVFPWIFEFPHLDPHLLLSVSVQIAHLDLFPHRHLADLA